MLQMMIGQLSSALRDRKGISAMEYGILAAAIIAAIIGVVASAATSLGTEITALFTAIVTKLTHVANSI